MNMSSPSNKILLRPFEPTDLSQVVHINRLCLPENYPPDFFLNLHQHFPETFVVAEKAGKIVAYIMCRIETVQSISPIGISRRGHVISIATLPKYQRRGIGRALMEKAMQVMALRYGVKECCLEVRVSNIPAINFYKQMGFQITKRMLGYYADGEDAYILARSDVSGFSFLF